MWRNLFCLGLGVLLTGTACSGPQKVVAVPPGVGENTIDMKASSFNFDPDVIRARQGDQLVLNIENVSTIEHNFTLKNPAGETLVSKDLPEHQTVRVEVLFPKPGDYPFLCDKPLHGTFGMKGRVIIEP